MKDKLVTDKLLNNLFYYNSETFIGEVYDVINI